MKEKAVYEVKEKLQIPQNMDQYTRRIIGFGVHAGTVDGVALCRMFNRAIRGQGWLPKYLSSDHDPLYKFHQWQANLRILEVTEIKTVPYVPLSIPSWKGSSAPFDASIWTTRWCVGHGKTRCSLAVGGRPGRPSPTSR
jgi:hypothetical protein